ncbi:unnamed protein product [Effrenium voratum]|nr:unnamed protein product [Effrenium voratum]
MIAGMTDETAPGEIEGLAIMTAVIAAETTAAGPAGATSEIGAAEVLGGPETGAAGTTTTAPGDLGLAEGPVEIGEEIGIARSATPTISHAGMSASSAAPEGLPRSLLVG